MYALKAIDYYLSIKAQFPDIDSWTAESVVAEFGEENMNTIKAIGTCFTTDVPWEDFRVFEKVVLCLNDRLVFGDIVQDLDIKEIALAVHVMKKLFPEKQFNDEVSKYIAIEAVQEGFVILPEELEFAQRFIPVTYLTREQEQVQTLYLQEVEDYVKAVNRGDIV